MTNSQRLEAVFSPDLEMGVNEQGEIYDYSPKTTTGWDLMRALNRADVQDIDKAMEVAARLGATVGTH